MGLAIPAGRSALSRRGPRLRGVATRGDRDSRWSVLGPQSRGKRRTTAGRSGHQGFAETAGRSTYNPLTSHGGDRRCGVRASPAAASPPGSCPRGGGHQGRASPSGRGGGNGATVCEVILAGRATSVPFTAVLNGPERITTDNHEAASTCTVPHRRR